MDINELKEILDKELNNTNSLLIDGVWGIGKTYYIKKYLNKKKHIYLSLFGLNNIKELESNLILELSNINPNFTHLKDYYNSESIFTTSFKNTIKSIVNSELIIVFDDIERNEFINHKEFLGLIDSISSIDNIKTILIANTKEIKNINDFNKYLEKAIDKKYIITKYSEESLTNIEESILNNSNIESILSIEKYNNYLTNFLQKYKVKNLRTIRRMIDFSIKVIKDFDASSISKGDLNNLLNVCFGIIVETVDNNYDKDRLIKEVVTNYLSNIIYPIPREELVEIVINLYLNQDYSSNIKKLNDYYNLIKSYKLEKTDKDLFLCSVNEIEKRINKFVKSSILKYNNKLTIDAWYNNLYAIYFYAEIIEKKDLIDFESIVGIMSEYVENIKCNEISLFNLILKMQHDSNKTDEALAVYKILKDKIVFKYFMYNYNNVLKNYENNNYDCKAIADLITFVVNPDFKNLNDFENAIKLLKNKKLFIPNIDGEIDSNIWDYLHEIWKGVSSSDESPNKRKLLNLLIQISNDMYQKTTPIGKYRITSLNEYYNVLQI